MAPEVESCTPEPLPDLDVAARHQARPDAVRQERPVGPAGRVERRPPDDQAGADEPVDLAGLRAVVLHPVRPPKRREVGRRRFGPGGKHAPPQRAGFGVLAGGRGGLRQPAGTEHVVVVDEGDPVGVRFRTPRRRAGVSPCSVSTTRRRPGTCPPRRGRRPPPPCRRCCCCPRRRRTTPRPAPDVGGRWRRAPDRGPPPGCRCRRRVERDEGRAGHDAAGARPLGRPLAGGCGHAALRAAVLPGDPLDATPEFGQEHSGRQRVTPSRARAELAGWLRNHHPTIPRSLGRCCGSVR